MPTMRVAVVAGAAAVLLVGAIGAAQAGPPETHVLTVRLPDGQTEQVRYTGNVPPTVVVEPDAVPASVDPAFPFALLGQTVANMDRRAAKLFQEVNTLETPQANGYSVFPVLSGPGVCMWSVQITYDGDAQGPRLRTRTEGSCGPVSGKAAPVALPNVPARRQPLNVLQVKAANPYQDLVQRVGDWQR